MAPMTKVDERACVPQLDAVRREALAAVLNRDGVVAASLFGSQAAGRTGPLSDVDLAVWLDPALSGEARSALRRELLAAAIHVLGTDEVDLVVLNDAPPLLQHRVLRDGVRLVERDARARVRLEEVRGRARTPTCATSG